jgi:hypothetical protein
MATFHQLKAVRYQNNATRKIIKAANAMAIRRFAQSLVLVTEVSKRDQRR